MLIAMHAYAYLVLHIFRLLLELLATRHLSDRQKDIEILLLRHQLRILQRKLPSSRSARVSVWEKGILAVLSPYSPSNSENALLAQASGSMRPLCSSNLTPCCGGTGS